MLHKQPPDRITLSKGVSDLAAAYLQLQLALQWLILVYSISFSLVEVSGKLKIILTKCLIIKQTYA